MKVRSLSIFLEIYVLLTKIESQSPLAGASNHSPTKSFIGLQNRDYGVLFRKYLWPVQTAGKSCSESERVLEEVTFGSQECPYPCSRDMVRFVCQSKCVKNDGCVGINYSKTMNEFRNYCGICTSNKLQSSTFGFEFYQKPKGCIDLWGTSVAKPFPITIRLNKNFEEIYGASEISMLQLFMKPGTEYTMVLTVSSTCPIDIEIGFSDKGGWFKTNVPASSNKVQITVIDTWEDVPNTRFENRMTCGTIDTYFTITIHQIQLFKGSWINGNCVPSENDACMQSVCKSCQMQGSETIAGTDLTFEECKSSCVKNDNCLGIDFGKGTKKGICWLQTEQNTITSHHESFDAWKKTSYCGMCTGDFEESDIENSGNGLQRPPAGTKCTSECFNDSGRWGSSWCYTDKNNFQWGAECVKCGSEKKLGWHLVGLQRECTGKSKGLGMMSTIGECARECKKIASMFAYGTNDFGTDRCYDQKCKCMCEPTASAEGTCNHKIHNGYRLYRYV